jgi:hypothetical protein
MKVAFFLIKSEIGGRQMALLDPLDAEAALDRAGELLDLGAENIRLIDNETLEEIALESFIDDEAAQSRSAEPRR